MFRTIIPVIDQDRTLGASIMHNSKKNNELKLMLYPFCADKTAKHLARKVCVPFHKAIETDKSINATVNSIKSKVRDMEAMAIMRYYYDNATNEVKWVKRSQDELSRSFDLSCYPNKLDPIQIHYFQCKGTTLNLSSMAEF